MVNGNIEIRKQGELNSTYYISRAPGVIQSLQVTYFSASGTFWKKNLNEDLNASISKLNYKFMILQQNIH